MFSVNYIKISLGFGHKTVNFFFFDEICVPKIYLKDLNVIFFKIIVAYLVFLDQAKENFLLKDVAENLSRTLVELKSLGDSLKKCKNENPTKGAKQNLA